MIAAEELAPQVGIEPACGALGAMIMGDLNFVPNSSQYDMIAGPLSPNHGRLVRR